MTMHTVYLKEHEGIVQNPTGQLSSGAVPWWGGIGSQSAYAESFGQFKSSSMEHPTSGGQPTSTKHAEHATELGLEKGNTTQFAIFPGNFFKSFELVLGEKVELNSNEISMNGRKKIKILSMSRPHTFLLNLVLLSS
ncbi:hypothetical protein CsSME_00046388 [Camellia sinensis var. sinensis]